ncbi:MAG: diguanylate cyclase [Opitutales bacterium]|nr:diguanylate cyclase [Opitutales bacterium]
MNILIIEDDPTAQLMMRGSLESIGYQTQTVSSGEDALAILEKPNPPQMILLDWELPGINGDEVCATIREKHTEDPPYIIFVTARTTSAAAVTALEKGASDFIRKPFNRGELKARVLVGKRSLDLQNELKLAEQKMARLAMYDTLTGLYNRRAMMEHLEKEISRGQRDRTSLIVTLADLDHFKQVNDQMGHLVGDQILQLFANTVHMHIRTSDTIARWGGEEFLILMPVSSPNGETQTILSRLDTIRQEFKENSLKYNVDSPVSVSFGATLTDCFDKVDNILQAADNALYEAKRSGRDRTVYGPYSSDKQDSPNSTLTKPPPSTIS